MAALSDQLLVVTLLAYLIAMISYAVEHAGHRAGHRARTTIRAATPVPAMSGTDAPPRPSVGDDPTDDQSDDQTDDRVDDTVGVAWAPAARLRWAGWTAVATTGVGALTHTACLVTRGLAAERVPWGNMYEFVLAVTLVGILAWLVLVLRRPAVRPVGLYVALAAVILLGLAGMRLYAPAGPLVPALNSAWLKIHVSTAAIASGIFLLGFIAATGYLVRLAHDRATDAGTPPGFIASLGRHLPTADTLERHSFQLHAVAFPIWTFAVAAGAIWAEAAWGRYWGWDPKETWAFISWVAYAGYLHARATPSVKRPVVAWLAVLGWATMMFNLFAVNLVIAGLHSYAGTD